MMIWLPSFDERVRAYLKKLGITESYPYIENGVRGEASTFEDLLYKAVFSYESLQIDKRESLSKEELRIVLGVLQYQKEMRAYYSDFKTKRSLTEEEIATFSDEKVRDKMTKAYHKNRGLYFISALQTFSSTTLFENPTIEKSEYNRPRKVRFVGTLSAAIRETFKIYYEAPFTFGYPVDMDGEVVWLKSIYQVYALALGKKDFTILKPYKFYSKQQRKNIKTIRKYQAGELGG